jgi:hypothetical protein
MFLANSRHFKAVAIWGGAISAAAAALSLIKFSPVVAYGIIAGAILGIFNIWSIVRLVEALAGAAAAGQAPGRASKSISVVMHVIKLILVFIILFILVKFKLVNLFALLAGFTVILVVNLFVGLSGLKEGSAGN